MESSSKVEHKLRLSPSQHDRLKMFAFKRNLKHQRVLVDALEAYLNTVEGTPPTEPTEGDQTPEERRYATALVSLLRSSDVRAPLARTMLDAWLKDPAAQTPPPKARGGTAKHEKKAG